MLDSITLQRSVCSNSIIYTYTTPIETKMFNRVHCRISESTSSNPQLLLYLYILLPATLLPKT